MKREATTRESLGLKETETMCEKCTHEEICRREQCGEPYCVIRSCFDFEAKRPRGEWICKGSVGDGTWCSVCDTNIKLFPNRYSFCPNCGASMRKEGEAEC